MIVIIRNYYNQCGRRASTPTIRLSAELFLCATNVRTGQLKRRKTGARLWLPIFLALEAEGHFRAGRDQTALHSIEQALATSEETGERWALAEILRVKANLLLTTGRGRPEEVERMLNEAWRPLGDSKRSVRNCARPVTLGDSGKSKGGAMRPWYYCTRFTADSRRGLETTDLHHAKALIDGLNADSVTPSARA